MKTNGTHRPKPGTVAVAGASGQRAVAAVVTAVQVFSAYVFAGAVDSERMP